MAITREEYEKIKGEGRYGLENCPFCKLDEKILWQGNHRSVVYNLASYTGNDQHIMAIPHTHKLYSHELSQEETAELYAVYQYVHTFFAGSLYFSCTRESMEGRSVEHLHIHFIAGKLRGKYLRYMLQSQGFPIVQDISTLIE